MGAEDAKGALRLLVFRVAGRRFGVPLSHVRGIQSLEGAAVEPGATAGFHGRTVAVVDARKRGWGGLPAKAREAPAVLVVVASGADERALAVDAVEGLVESAGIREWPSLVAPFVRATFLGLAEQPGGEVPVVDPAALCGGAAAGVTIGKGA